VVALSLQPYDGTVVTRYSVSRAGSWVRIPYTGWTYFYRPFYFPSVLWVLRVYDRPLCSRVCLFGRSHCDTKHISSFNLEIWNVVLLQFWYLKMSVEYYRRAKRPRLTNTLWPVVFLFLRWRFFQRPSNDVSSSFPFGRTNMRMFMLWIFIILWRSPMSCFGFWISTGRVTGVRRDSNNYAGFLRQT